MRWRFALAGMVVLAAGAAALPVHAADPIPADDPGAETSEGDTVLGDSGVPSSEAEPVHGEEAVALLDELETAEIIEIAASVDMAPDELIDELRADESLFVTGEGAVGFVDSLAADELHHDELHDGEFTAAELSWRPTRPAGVDVFALDSKPGTTKVIYLDFDGHFTPAGSRWPAPITSAPFDRDGNPAGFSDSERDDIYEIWHRVSEDYAPFDVNVTTRDPGIEGLRRTSAADTAYGTRVVISPTRFAGYTSTGTIGVAFVNVFGALNVDEPAFVFTSVAAYNNPRVIGEAAAHEAGHTFGLRHDGHYNSDYYGGHNQWAPIMGLSISRAVTQWSRGEYPGATNTEDDIAVIAAKVGFRADDVGNTFATARALALGSTFDGVLGAADVDVFVVNSSGGFTVELAPIADWANLLAYVEVFDSAGRPVAMAAPTVPNGWSLTAGVPLPAGRYSVVVRPTGWGTAANGFTSYGSAGQYRLSVRSGAGVLRWDSSRVSAVAPDRILDTRTGLGGPRRLAAGGIAEVQVTGTRGVPAGAQAAVVNVTAVNASGSGFLTVYPCSARVPDTSNVNYVAGQNVANTTIAALSPDGRLCVYSYAAADVLVDVTGWVGPGGESRFNASGPSRLVDTRRGLGASRLSGGQTVAIDFTGKVPAGATAVSFNLTAVGAQGAAHMTAYPCGQTLPGTSTVNFRAGEARPNNAIVRLGNGQRVCFYSPVSTDFIVDLTGYFASSGLGYVPSPPDRILDTRRTSPSPRPARTVLPFGASRSGLTVESAFVNVTSVDHPRPGFVTVYGCGPVPDTSTVNQVPGEANANGANVRASSCAWISDTAHVIVDLNGWWVR